MNYCKQLACSLLSLMFMLHTNLALSITIKTCTEIRDENPCNPPAAQQPCCPCDFFITQTATGGNNHPISAPLTQPGTYCLAENVTGTITIATSNVIINFKGYTLTASGAGVTSDGNDNIAIEGGTIVAGSPAIELLHGNNCSVSSMVFTGGNTTAVVFENVRQGKITDCQCYNNSSLDTLTLIRAAACQGLICDSVNIWNNNAQTAFRGIQLENCDDSAVTQCRITNNSVASEANAALFVGIEITGSGNGDSKRNSLVNNIICDNAVSSEQSFAFFIATSVGSAINSNYPSIQTCSHTTIDRIAAENNNVQSGNNGAFFSGIAIACAVGASGVTLGNDNAQNCVVEQCAINNNTCHCSSGVEFSGISFAGIIAGGTVGLNNVVGDNAASELRITNCTINNNDAVKDPSNNSGAIFTGITLGGNLGGLSTIGNNGCVNASINNCTVNNNRCTFSGGDNGAAFMYGINIGGSLGGPATVGNDACGNCSLELCSINNNQCISGSVTFFAGFNIVGSFNGGGTVGRNACENFSIRTCMANNNASTAPGNCAFAGLALGTLTGDSCNNGVIDTLSISGNIMSAAQNFSAMGGILMNGAAGTANGGCNNIICSHCLVELNSTDTGVGSFYGFYINGTGAATLEGGCNNLTLNDCQVHDNKSMNDSHAYACLGTTSPELVAGLRNLHMHQCSAKNNSSSSLLHGFNFESLENAAIHHCDSVANSSDGFRFSRSANSTVQSCLAFNNGNNGFTYENETSNITILDNQALNNESDGFSFAVTTTECLVSNNIAQNNFVGFNNEEDDECKHQFLNNKAQANVDENYVNVPLVTTPADAVNPYGNIES